MDSKKICTAEAIALLVMIMINQVILGLPKTIIVNSGSGAWINVIVISIIAIFLAVLITKLFKKFPASDILDVSELVGGKILKIIVSIIFFSLFFLTSIICLRYIVETLILIYFKNTNILFLILLFVIGIIIANRKSFTSIARANYILTIIILAVMFILFVFSTKLFVTERLFPILGYGADKTFLLGLSNLSAFSGLAYILFLLPFLKETKSFKKINVISIVISSLYLFLSVVCLLLVFPFNSISENLLSVYLLTRIVEYSSFLQRADAIYILFWILAILSYLSINMFFMLHIFQKNTNIKNHTGILYAISLILIATSLIIQGAAEHRFLQNTVYFYLFLFAIGLSLVILFIANWKRKKHNSNSPPAP